MILQVNAEWRIKSDSQQWIVQRFHTPVSAKGGHSVGEPFWVSEAYTTRPDSAAFWLAEKRIRDLPGTYPAADALEVLGEALQQIVKETKRAMEGLGHG